MQQIEITGEALPIVRSSIVLKRKIVERESSKLSKTSQRF